MKKTRSGVLIVLVSAGFLACGGPSSPPSLSTAQGDGVEGGDFISSPSAAAKATSMQQKFQDDFETNKGWSLFEEIVDGSACYGSGIGEVSRATDAALNGSQSLRVWANKLVSTSSNHVIAQKQLSASGQTGIWRYEFSAYIPPELETSGQAGPEFSMQNTRQVGPGVFKTTTAGIQYQASPFASQLGSWAIWKEQAPGQANWAAFLTQPLSSGQWYDIAVEADYRANTYVRFWLRGPGVNHSVDLSSIKIAQESKFSEEAFWLTLESENLWNNCGMAGTFNYKVYYDKVRVYAR